MSVTRLWKSLLAGSCLVTFSVLTPLESSAAKPGSGGGGTAPPPGTIYFYRQDDTSRYTVWRPMTMNGDGSGKAAAPQIGFPNNPSSSKHAGSRWFLEEDYDWDGETDPWGNPPLELFAYGESGVRVQLTRGPDVVRSGGRPTWAKNDSFVSFPAVMRTGNGVVGGLFVAFLDWSTGAPVAGPPVLVVKTEVHEDPDWWGWSWTGFQAGGHDWSPDGTQVAFEVPTNNFGWQILVARLSSEGAQIDPLALGSSPAWSPTGGRIAFSSGGSLWTINPDGTGAVRLTQATATNKEQRSQGGPTWSPNGAYLAFTEVVRKNNGAESRSVLRIGSAGGATVDLTSDIGNAGGPQWRN